MIPQIPNFLNLWSWIQISGLCFDKIKKKNPRFCVIEFHLNELFINSDITVWNSFKRSASICSRQVWSLSARESKKKPFISIRRASTDDLLQCAYRAYLYRCHFETYLYSTVDTSQVKLLRYRAATSPSYIARRHSRNDGTPFNIARLRAKWDICPRCERTSVSVITLALGEHSALLGVGYADKGASIRISLGQCTLVAEASGREEIWNTTPRVPHGIWYNRLKNAPSNRKRFEGKNLVFSFLDSWRTFIYFWFDQKTIKRYLHMSNLTLFQHFLFLFPFYMAKM